MRTEGDESKVSVHSWVMLRGHGWDEAWGECVVGVMLRVHGWGDAEGARLGWYSGCMVGVMLGVLA